MINSLHRDKYGSLPVCTEIFSFDFAGKSYPPFIEYALTHNQHVCPIFVHSHEEPELIHVLNGELDITTGGRRARLRKGETALISPHRARSGFCPRLRLSRVLLSHLRSRNPLRLREENRGRDNSPQAGRRALPRQADRHSVRKGRQKYARGRTPPLPATRDGGG